VSRAPARRALAASTTLLCVSPFVAALFGVPLDLPLASVTAQTGFDSSPASLWHALIEWTGFGVALASAITVLVLYSARREAAMPVVGVAMLAAGSLDAAHMLASTGLAHEGNVSLPALESLTWLISRTSSALILLTGALVISGRARAHRGPVHLRWRGCAKSGGAQQHFGVGVAETGNIVADRVEHVAADESSIGDLRHALADRRQCAHRVALLATGEITRHLWMQQGLTEGALALGHETCDSLPRLCGNAFG